MHTHQREWTRLSASLHASAQVYTRQFVVNSKQNHLYLIKFNIILSILEATKEGRGANFKTAVQFVGSKALFPYTMHVCMLLPAMYTYMIVHVHLGQRMLAQSRGGRKCVLVVILRLVLAQRVESPAQILHLFLHSLFLVFNVRNLPRPQHRSLQHCRDHSTDHCSTLPRPQHRSLQHSAEITAHRSLQHSAEITAYGPLQNSAESTTQFATSVCREHSTTQYTVGDNKAKCELDKRPFTQSLTCFCSLPMSCLMTRMTSRMLSHSLSRISSLIINERSSSA